MARRKTHEEFLEDLKKVNTSMVPIDQYINGRKKIRFQCSVCGDTRPISPSSVLNGTGCSVCNKRPRKDTASFKKELEAINPNITVLGEYISAHKPIEVRCNRCNYTWSPEANSLLKGNDCKMCSHSQTSFVEQLLYHSFASVLGKTCVISRDRKTIRKELDVLIPNLNLAVEFGAWYWHQNKIQNDIEKQKLCEEKGIRLITIYEGCPENTRVEGLKNALCFSQVISRENDLSTIKGLILDICSEYRINTETIDSKWEQIVKRAKEESRKRDAESFAKELSKRNPAITYINGYTGSNDPVNVRCNTCGKEWPATSAYDLLNGVGCPVCGRKRANDALRMKENEFRKKLKKINPHIKITGEFKDLDTPIDCLCTICKKPWLPSPKPRNLIYRKVNCPTCSPRTKKTKQRFIEELKSINPNIILLGEYTNMRTETLFECKKCKNIWPAKPGEIKRGKGCPECANNKRITREEFVKRVTEKNRNIKILGEYVNKKTKVKCLCLNCKTEWFGWPDNLMKGSGCKKCAGTLPLTQEEFENRVKKISPYIRIVGKYVNENEPVDCICTNCGTPWSPRAGNLLNGHGCRKCSRILSDKINRRSVRCVETGEIYRSISEAKEKTGISSINDCLKKRTKTAGGYHWEYIEETNL